MPKGVIVIAFQVGAVLIDPDCIWNSFPTINTDIEFIDNSKSKYGWLRVTWHFLFEKRIIFHAFVDSSFAQKPQLWMCN